MPISYSNDFRLKIIEEIKENNHTKTQIAKRFRVSRSFVYNLWARFKKTGSYEAKPRGNTTPPKVDAIGEEHIREWLSNEPDLTLRDLCERYDEHFNILMGKSSMDRALKRMKMTYKKSLYDPKKYSERVEKLRIEYTEEIEKIDRDRLFFIDEMGANMNHSPLYSPLYGRAPSDERVYDDTPAAKGQRISMVGALTTSGMEAAFNFTGTMTGTVFLYFLEHFLCPLLSEGDYVVMDNTSVHKVDDVRHFIEKTGAKLIYLPPYSPELNPIELAWNKMKTHIRKQRARTFDQLYEVYAEALEAITMTDSRKFVAHAMGFLK